MTIAFEDDVPVSMRPDVRDRLVERSRFAIGMEELLGCPAGGGCPSTGFMSPTVYDQAD